MKKLMAMMVAVLFVSATTMAQVQPTVKSSEKKAPTTEMKTTSKKSMKKKPKAKMKKDTSKMSNTAMKTEKKAVKK